MKKFFIFFCLAMMLLSNESDAARRRYRSVPEKQIEIQKPEPKFFWGIYGGYNNNNQLIERGSTGSLNFNGNGNYYAALEANFINPGFDYALGIGYTGSRLAVNVTGLTSQNLTGVSWSSIPLYFLTRYKLGETLYVTAGLSYSLITIQGSQINTLHGSTSFTTAGSLGYCVGLGININSSMMLDLKYLIDRGTITFIGGANNGNAYPLEASGFVLSLGYRL